MAKPNTNSYNLNLAKCLKLQHGILRPMYDLAMETTAVKLPLFLRTNRFDKRPHKVLTSVGDELLSLQTRIESENCGEGIEATTALANELISIHKRIYDLLEDVQTLVVSEFRREAMNQNEGLEEVVQQVEECEETTLGAVMQPVVENPVVVLKLMPSEGWSWWRSKEKKSQPVIKKLKQKEDNWEKATMVKYSREHGNPKKVISFISRTPWKLSIQSERFIWLAQIGIGLLKGFVGSLPLWHEYLEPLRGGNVPVKSRM